MPMNITANLKITKYKQRGFTLIELMISIVIGLIVLAAVISMFVTMIKSDNDNLKSIRLNQELRAAMSLITRNIRRAGANQNAAVNSSTTPPTNPFSSLAGGTRLTITVNQQGIPNSCITYSYDANDGSNELYGYRQQGWNNRSPCKWSSVW
jgi:prepilin peptidase dependent protein B